MKLETLKKFHHTIPAHLDVGRGTSVVLLVPRSGSYETSSFVNTDEN